MKKKLKNSKIANLTLRLLGLSLCILPPLICTASYFPLWQRQEEFLSGGVLLLVLICALPLYKILKKVLSSPASYTVWLILFILFFSLSKIAEQMTVISFVGFLGNALGALCFYIARAWRRDKE